MAFSPCSLRQYTMALREGASFLSKKTVLAIIHSIHLQSLRGRNAEPGTQSREFTALDPRFALRPPGEDGQKNTEFQPLFSGPD